MNNPVHIYIYIYIYNVPSPRRGTQGFHKGPPSHSILSISFDLHRGLLNSFGLSKFCSSPCIPLSPPAPFTLRVPLQGLPGYIVGRVSQCMARMGEERGVYRFLLGKPEGRRPLERPRRRWVDNIRMDLQEVRCGYMDWIGLAHDRDRWRTLVSAVMNLGVP